MLEILGRKREATSEQLKRTYQNDLRAIGRYADDSGHRNVGVYEVNAGFIVRATPRTDSTVIEALEIPDSDLTGLILKNFTARRGRGQDASPPPLCPTGYEDFLRALGYELDKISARNVTVQEMVDCFAVSYQELAPTAEGYAHNPRSLILDMSAIQEILDEAFRRRGAR